jgi:hypothetical protein
VNTVEIGSFIPLELPTGREFYSGCEAARLNSGRAGIWHALRVLNCNTVWLPRYECESVRQFLLKKQISIKYYSINDRFDPVDIRQTKEEAVLLVNYFGVMNRKRMAALASQYHNVILDNAQAFYTRPIENYLSVYSARKFFGVPDGAYVLGKNAARFMDTYKRDLSSDTSNFLLQRIEYGCEGKAYTSRKLNERRIDESDIKRMSALTQMILDGTDYAGIRRKRKENFQIACDLFDGINRFDIGRYLDSDCVPMVYPLITGDDQLLERLIAKKHFQGPWWAYLTAELPETAFESYLSRYLAPITIDQRYGRRELEYLKEVVG